MTDNLGSQQNATTAGPSTSVPTEELEKDGKHSTNPVSEMHQLPGLPQQGISEIPNKSTSPQNANDVDLSQTLSRVAIDDSDLPPPSAQPLSPARLFLVAATVTFTLCMSSAGSQALNIGLPTIQTDLHMIDSDLQWIASAYSLTNGCFLLLSGRLADVHGRKLVFVTGVLWFALWTMIGGFMKNGAGLVVTRALAGCGAAMSTPSAVGIIAQNFTGKARSTAFACFSAGAPVGGAIGLIIGGLFVSYVKNTWRGALFLLAGLAFFISVVALFTIPSDVPHSDDKRIDWIGAALVTVGLILLQFTISAGQTAPHGWKTGYIIALLIIGFLLVVSFFLWERYIINETSRPPLMRLKLWTRAKGRLASVYFIGFVAWMGFVSLFYHATLYYQQVQETGPIGAMLRFLPTSVSGVLCNVIVAFLISVIPTQWLVCVGLIATGLGNVCFALSWENTNYWRLPFNGMWLSVMGADFLMATGLIFVAALSLPDEHSVAGALFQTLMQLGGSFGLAITTVISDVQFDKAYNTGGKSYKESLLEGYHAAFWLGAATSFLALLIAIIALRGMGTIGKGVKRSKDNAVDDQIPMEGAKGRGQGVENKV
ncbi:efflux protein [Kwoniella mangroviensis CBS 10435]|uniref:Efflux protein n=1 Tax=Kwoniella mangroviensis CBS 10435 TaxID=1331196 RepID=A0A1B9II11_9TREE|nr:efflux protein [Kwoniella mangroviensis CBS 8507]OCF55329.1 efflux protein [Kwoniella mangroviensis CBS 10435]OCF65982.1 efflux protein [Kwoniella mangroviensis CBS 8507]OCF71944.1 efflux protein [Kwoniella mangroviensis CBS 8886]